MDVSLPRIPLLALTSAALLCLAPNRLEADSRERHTVRPQESLSEIVLEWARDWAKNQREQTSRFKLYGEGQLIDQTLRLNPEISDPDLIFPGMQISFPVQEQTETEPRPVPTSQPELKAEPAQETREAPESAKAPWDFDFYFRGGAKVTTSSESIAGKTSETANRWSLPQLEAELRLGPEQQPWQGFLVGSASGGSTVSGTPFPWTFGFEGGISRLLSTSAGIRLGLSVSRQTYLQGTPDVSRLSQVVSPEILVRKTQATWIRAQVAAPLSWGVLPSTLGFGVGRTLSASSETGAGGAALNDLSGTLLGASFETLPFNLLGRPLGAALRLERAWFSSEADSTSHSMVSSFLVIRLD